MSSRFKYRFLWLPAWIWLVGGAALLLLRLQDADPVWRLAPEFGLETRRESVFVRLGRDAEGNLYDLRDRPNVLDPLAVAAYFDDIRVGSMWPRPVPSPFRPSTLSPFAYLSPPMTTNEDRPPLFEPMWLTERSHLGIQFSKLDQGVMTADEIWKVAPQIEALIERGAAASHVRLATVPLSRMAREEYDVERAPRTYWTGSGPVFGVWSTSWHFRLVPRSIARNSGLVFGPLFLAIGIVVLLFPRRTIRLIRRGKGLCPHCRYDLKFHFDKVCPECGNDPKTDG